MSGKYALIIANTEYADAGLAQLTAPGRDARDFARVLEDKEIAAFDDVQVVMNEPSALAIETIDEFFDQKKPDDLLVFYFSGHGIKDESGSLYLAFKNTVRSRLRSTAVKSEYIRDAMDQSRSKRQVLILDCCNSGAFPQGTKAELGGPMGMTKAFQGYGRFILTASDATQFAWEGERVIGNTDKSLFTHFLVKGLEGDADSDGDGRITVDELYDYAYHEISKVTPNQTPTKSASKQEGEIYLRQNMRIEDIKPVPLPSALLDSIENPLPDIRLGVVQQLAKLLNGKNLGLARSAREVLERIENEDDSRVVSRAAQQALEPVRQVEEERREAERLIEEKALEEQKAKKAEERTAFLKVEQERLEREQKELESLRAKQAEEERIAKAKEIARLYAEEKQHSLEITEAKPTENQPVFHERTETSQWYQVWMKALLSPSQKNFTDILQTSNINLGRAYLWVFVTALIFYIAEIPVSYSATARGMSENFNSVNSISTTDYVTTTLLGAPIGALISTLIFAAWAAIVQWLAKLFGGKGNVTQMTYALGAVAAPVFAVNTVLVLLVAVPYVANCSLIASVLLQVYLFLVGIIAVKSVNQIGWGSAIFAVLIPPFAALLVFCVLFTILGSMIVGSLFQSQP